jgi:hypothetical protein
MEDRFDLLELLHADHVNLQELDGTLETELAVAKHLTTERELLYPLVAKHGICSEEELNELHQLDRGLEQAVVDALKDPSAGTDDMNASIASHVSVQEALFALVREGIDHQTLLYAGGQVERITMEAPRHIHPHLPDHGLLMGDMAVLAEFADEIEDDLGRKHPQVADDIEDDPGRKDAG